MENPFKRKNKVETPEGSKSEQIEHNLNEGEAEITNFEASVGEMGGVGKVQEVMKEMSPEEIDSVLNRASEIIGEENLQKISWLKGKKTDVFEFLSDPKRRETMEAGMVTLVMVGLVSAIVAFFIEGWGKERSGDLTNWKQIMEIVGWSVGSATFLATVPSTVKDFYKTMKANSARRKEVGREAQHEESLGKISQNVEIKKADDEREAIMRQWYKDGKPGNYRQESAGFHS